MVTILAKAKDWFTWWKVLMLAGAQTGNMVNIPIRKQQLQGLDG
jgi:hypothetical protein